MNPKSKQIVHVIKFKLGEGVVTLEKVKQYIANEGWEIIEYGSEKCSTGNEMLQTLDLWDYATRHESLAYTDGKRTIIFLNVKRNASSLFLLLHEITHILAKHTVYDGIYGKDDPKAEKQANQVANLVLGNTFLRRLRQSKAGLICSTTLVAIIFIGFGIFLSNMFQTQPTYKETTPSQHWEPTPPTYTIPASTPKPTATTIPQGQTVWVARTGEVYHTDKTCFYIRNKTDLLEIDVSEAIEIGLRPCSYCSK